MPQEQTKHEARNYHRTQMKRELIIQKLREQGCRITRQRRILLDIILEEECSCCKEIYYKALQKDSSIGPATVYRMVNTLESIGAISRKNFYKIACGEECFKDQGCTVELSDHTICRLSGEMWMDVMKSGLKAKGYIQNQDIENVIVSAVEGRKTGKTGENSFRFPCFNENNYQKELYVLSNRAGECYTVNHSGGKCKIQEKFILTIGGNVI